MPACEPSACEFLPLLLGARKSLLPRNGPLARFGTFAPAILQEVFGLLAASSLQGPIFPINAPPPTSFPLCVGQLSATSQLLCAPKVVSCPNKLAHPCTNDNREVCRRFWTDLDQLSWRLSCRQHHWGHRSTLGIGSFRLQDRPRSPAPSNCDGGPA